MPTAPSPIANAPERSAPATPPEDAFDADPARTPVTPAFDGPATLARSPLPAAEIPDDSPDDGVALSPAAAPEAPHTAPRGTTAAPIETVRVTPTAAAVARRPATARPLLRAERRPRPAPPEARAATAAGSSGARLAQALGLPLAPQADGSVTVSFDASTPATPPSSPVLARALEIDELQATPMPETAPPAAPAPAGNPAPAAPAPAGGPPAPSLEDIYDHVVERLRRDLLVERERMGDLTGRLP
jgi:hypothetical protein